MSDESRIIRTLLREGRKAMLRKYAPDSCIAAARLVVDVLTHFGITSSPVPTRLYVYTHPLFQRLAANRFERPYRKGEYGLQVGADLGNPEKFPGHLVVTTSKRLIDLSLDQASRPQFGLPLAPATFHLQERWPQVVQTREAVLSYVAIDNYSFQSAPDWVLSERLATIRQEIIKKL